MGLLTALQAVGLCMTMAVHRTALAGTHWTPFLGEIGRPLWATLRVVRIGRAQPDWSQLTMREKAIRLLAANFQATRRLSAEAQLSWS